jgi:cardiolipin synthase
MFTPRLRYHMPTTLDPESDEFLGFLENSSPSQVYRDNDVQVLKDGDTFCPAMLDAIRQARRTINLECFVFKPGQIADAFVEALTERAGAGVTVTVVLDAIGGFSMTGTPLRRLREAGCRVTFYQTARWYTLTRINNRTHRELLIVDGCVAFTGGPGIADYWRYPIDGEPPWRDTSLRLAGPIVAALQGVFAENWLEASGELLAGDHYYPALRPEGAVRGLVFKSSPADRTTVSRVLFHSLIACARQTIRISTPYFIPDRGMREALIHAARRGVRVEVLVPGGTNADQPLLRIASRKWFGELLRGGVRIFEYERAMIHQKLLLVDSYWAVMGTTNMDNRSFEHNDEVNVAFPDRNVAAGLERLYEVDLALARPVTLREWEGRPPFEKAVSQIAWVLDRQQ